MPGLFPCKTINNIYGGITFFLQVVIQLLKKLLLYLLKGKENLFLWFRI